MSIGQIVLRLGKSQLSRQDRENIGAISNVGPKAIRPLTFVRFVQMHRGVC